MSTTIAEARSSGERPQTRRTLPTRQTGNFQSMPHPCAIVVGLVRAPTDLNGFQQPPRRHTSATALAGMSAAGCYIWANSPGRTTEFIAVGTHFLQSQCLRSGQVAIYGHMMASPESWEMWTPTRDVDEYFFQAAVWAPTTGEKDACLEDLMEQQDWDEAPPSLADPIRVKAAPTNFREPPPVMKSPPSQIQVEQRHDRLPHKIDHAVTQCSTLSKGLRPTTMTFDVYVQQAFLGVEPPLSALPSPSPTLSTDDLQCRINLRHGCSGSQSASDQGCLRSANSQATPIRVTASPEVPAKQRRTSPSPSLRCHALLHCITAPRTEMQ